MKILINGREETAKYSGDNLGSLLDQIKSAKVLPGTYINTLLLNGRPLEPDAEKTRSIPVTEIETLEIEIITILDILSKNIANVEDYLKKLIPGIEKTAELFQMGNDQEASQLFVKIVDGIEWVSQALNEILKALMADPNTLQVNGKTIQERHNTLIDLTNQLLEAHKNKDWVLVADLLAYEIAPYYKEWQETIPELKKMAQEIIN
ncbi:MAG: hypothetical protein ACE5G9_11160 [Nitrospinales bacterium]